MKKLLLVLVASASLFSLSRIGSIAPNVPKEKVQINGNAYTQAIKKRLVNDSNVIKVAFDLNGGTYNGSSQNFSYTIEAGELITAPDKSSLSRSFATFEEWQDENGNEWNFDEDIPSSDLTLRAIWDWNNSYRAGEVVGHDVNDNNVHEFLEIKHYGSHDWVMDKNNSKSLLDVTGYVPIEMQGDNFPREDVLTAVDTSGSASSYGGCGPIAMMGILDYYARYRGYTTFMEDPNNKYDRIRLAYDVLTNTKTIELPSFSKSFNEDQVALASSDDKNKNTFTWPSDYVAGFNAVVSQHNLSEELSCTSESLIYSNKINIIKNSINNGSPATMFGGLAGNGDLGNHYVNIYEYQTWNGIDRDGNNISELLLVFRLNWGWGDNIKRYASADFLKNIINTGVIGYTTKHNSEVIRPIDFSEDFVNDQGQGQYFYYEKEADIILDSGFKFGTTRLRCGYIEDEYLVLSSKRDDAGTAYLEFDFDVPITAINFDISLWSGLEGLTDYNSSVRLESRSSKESDWTTEYDFVVSDLATSKDLEENMYFKFSTPKDNFRFIVECDNPSGDRNKGRVVLGDITLFY